jgi:UDP:flavonoid glycosyltransferase YjiC (YdhE family)
VTFAGQRAVVPRLAAHGFDAVVVGPDTLGSERLPLQRVDREWERTVVRDHFVRRFGAFRANAIADVLRELVPDAVLCDEIDVGALVAAEAAGIPAITVNVAAAGRLLTQEVVGEAWNELRRAHGLVADPDGNALGGSLMLAPFPASFRDPTLPRPPQWQPVRLAPAPAKPAPESPVEIYATLGTVFNVESGDLLSRIVAGLGQVDRNALVTVGPHIAPEEFAPAAHVRVEQFVPQHEVLGGCRAVICHGGSGTLMAALSTGIPVVVLPMGADQPDNADRCEELGCGLVLDAVDATADDIAAAVRRVTDEPRFGINARRLADEVVGQPDIGELPQLLALLRG